MQMVLMVPLTCQTEPRDWFECGCPATFASPAEFCPQCQADWENWLDVLYLERLAEEGGDLGTF